MKRMLFRGVAVTFPVAALWVLGTASSRPVSVSDRLPAMGTEHSISTARAFLADCITMCTECNTMGAVGTRREYGPLPNNELGPNSCDPTDSCANGGCAPEALAVADQLDAAIRIADWARTAALSHIHAAFILPDPQRDVVDVVGCDGKTVVATIPLPRGMVAAIAPATSPLPVAEEARF